MLITKEESYIDFDTESEIVTPGDQEKAVTNLLQNGQVISKKDTVEMFPNTTEVVKNKQKKLKKKKKYVRHKILLLAYAR